MRKILLTGCTGLVGRNLLEYFLERGDMVYGTSRHTLLSRHQHFHPLTFDLRDVDENKDFLATLQACDIVIHNAAKVPKKLEESDEYFVINAQGTIKVLQQAYRSGVSQFVYISSTACVAQGIDGLHENLPYYPQNSYASSKIVGEIYCQQYNYEEKMKCAVLRIRAPYGIGGNPQAVIPKFLALAKASQNITLWGNGKREQNFTYVRDIARACELAIEHNAAGIYNIASASSVTMKQLADTIIQCVPETASQIVFTGKPDPEEGKTVNISCEKARRELGYVPQFSLQEGIMDLLKREREIAPYTYQT